MHINDLLKIAVASRRVRPAPEGRQLPDDAGQRHAGRRLGREAARSQRHRGDGERCSSRPSTARSSARAQEVDLAYSVAGLGRFRCNVFQQRGTVGLVLRVIPTRIQTDRRARPAAGPQADRRGGARPGARHRHDRQRQEHHARGDDRPHQRDARGAHHDGRGPDRVPAPRPSVDRQPARGRGRHAVVLARAAQRPAAGSRRHPGRRDARLRDGRDGAARRRDRAPRVLDAAHARRHRNDQPHHLGVPAAPAAPGPHPARDAC